MHVQCCIHRQEGPQWLVILGVLDMNFLVHCISKTLPDDLDLSGLMLPHHVTV